MKVSTQWLKDFVTLPPPLERIAERLTMAGLEVKKIIPAAGGKDILFELEITSNRPDWLSHLGVAREIAAVENLPLKIPSLESANRPMPSGWKLQLKEAGGCPYYTGVYIEGIMHAPTPDFIRERLTACGVRSVSLIVDITNYVLLETGQPLHAFDADRLRGREIQIRRARSKEVFFAIDGSRLEIIPEDLVIADSERPVALAGVMGGKDSEINERTRNLFLESAFFHPRWVRLSSRRYGLSSESSYRFERRVDPEGVDFGRERAVALIKQYAQPRFISGVMRGGERPQLAKPHIHLSLSEIEKHLGLSMKSHQVASILTRLGLEVKPDSRESWNIGVPSFRADLGQSADLIEEVARIHGYDQIPETLPAREPLAFQEDSRLRLEERTRQFLSGIGFYETVTFSLISGMGLDPEQDLQGAVSVHNPLNKELTWMRPVLLPSLLDVIRHNHHFGAAGAGFYEMANVYRQGAKKGHPEEERMLALALFGKWRAKSWLDPERSAGFYDLKGAVEAFLGEMGIKHYTFEPVHKSFLQESSSEKILISGKEGGFIGEVHSRLLRSWDFDFNVYFAEISLEKLSARVHWVRPLEDIPRFPAIHRDLAVVVPESVRAGEIETEIHRLGKGLIFKVRLFDLYRGGRIPNGYRNLAFRVTYQSKEKTLISEEIQKLHSEIGAAMVRKFQAAFQ